MANEARARAPKTSPMDGKLVSSNQAPPMPVQAYSPQTAIAFMDSLARRFNADDLADKLHGMMDAMLPPIQTRNGKLIERPDNSTRLRAIEFVYAYVVGRPIERQQIVTSQHGGTIEDIINKAATSPVFAKTARNLLQNLLESLPEDDSKTPRPAVDVGRGAEAADGGVTGS